MSSQTPSSDAREKVGSAPTERPPAPDSQAGTASVPGIASAPLPSVVSVPAAAPVPAAARGPAPAAPPSAAEAWIGRVIDDRYRIVEVLGEGGMGSVFVAEHLKLPKQVALKVIRPEFAGNGEVAARFAREAMASATLDHPHIASALDYGTLPEGGAYLVMQLVRGWSLRSIIEREKKLDWRKACRIGAQIADALAGAHAADIVHRDLKPDNVLIETRDDDHELVKVLDFGIALAMSRTDGGARLTETGMSLGTPHYMSPEQALGERTVDLRTDVYALGAVLYEMLVGEPPFVAEEMSEIFAKQLTETPPTVAVAAKDPTIPAVLSSLVSQLLAPKAERPDRASQVRDTLRQLAMTAAPRAGDAPVSLASHPAVISARQSIEPLLERAKRLPPATLALGCAVPVVAVLLIAVIALAVGDDDEEPTATTQVVTVPIPVVTNTDGRRPRGQEPVGRDTPVPAAVPRIAVPRGLSPEAAAHVTTLFESDDRDARQDAAEALLVPAVAARLPPYVSLAAQLERARGCQKKKPVVIRIGDLGDPRALPALDRLSNMSRGGCGFLGLGDCYSCLRTDLARVRTELRARLDPTGTPTPTQIE